MGNKILQLNTKIYNYWLKVLLRIRAKMQKQARNKLKKPTNCANRLLQLTFT